jgi:uncharacterized protein (TIGR03086 family)
MTNDIPNQKELFLVADAALKSVIDQIRPEQLDLAAPGAWSRSANPTVRDILAAHARDEAWVADVVAGRTMEEVGTRYDGDLLGADPIANYDRINEQTTAALAGELDLSQTAHLSYGDFPLATFFEHTSFYRAFQSWDIAKFLGIPYSMPTELVDALWIVLEPQFEELRAIHVFGPEVAVPEGSDSETRLLGKAGFWVP